MSEETDNNNLAESRRENKSAPQYDAYGENVHGTRISMRLYVLSMATVAAMSFIVGGLILPYLKFKPKISQEETQKGQSVEKNALKVSIGPQTVWAAPTDGTDPIATGLSVEQILSEYEVLASQAGLLTNLEFVRSGEKVEARFAFKEREKQQEFGGVIGKASEDFPRSLVLIFSASPTPGAIVLQEARENGKPKSAGAIFVDLIKMGGVAPELSQGQYLTPKGIFEIRAIENGVAAFIDKAQVYPEKPDNGFLNLAANSPNQQNKEEAAQILQLRGIQPNNAVFRERFIMVASDANSAECTSRAIIFDVPRQKVEVLEYALKIPNVTIADGKNAIILGGFCEKPQPSSATNPNQSQTSTKSNYHIEAIYNIQNGAISYNRVLNQLPSAPIVSALHPASGWRASSPNRIASPLGTGSALVSISCQPGGGLSLSLAGIPAPADQKAARISFGATNANASAGMRWITTAASYEINEISRPQEFRAILQAFRSDGQITISGSGARSSIASPGKASIDALRANCGSAPQRPTPTAPMPPKSQASAPKAATPSATKPKPAAPKTPAAIAPKQTANNLPSFTPTGAPKAVAVAPKAKPAKKQNSEAQAVDAPKKK